MSSHHTATILLFLIFANLFSFSLSGKTEVVDLTNDNFEQLTKEGSWLVDFFAPWCPHCKRLAPIFDDASVTLLQERIPVTFAKVDCTVHGKLCQRYGIRGYPTLKMFKNGAEISDYNGERTVEGLLSFSRKMSGPSILKLGQKSKNPRQEFDDLRKQFPVLFMIVGGSDAVVDIFTQLSAKYHTNAAFVSVKESDAQPHFPELLPLGSIVLFNDITENIPKVYFGDMTFDKIEEWIKQHRYPVFGELDANSWNTYSASDKPLVVAVLAKQPDQKSNSLRDIIRSIAAYSHDDLLFTWMLGHSNLEFASQLGVTPKNFPTLVIVDPVGEQFYPYNQEDLDKVSIEHYLSEFSEGKIAPQGPSSIWVFLKRNVYLLIFGGCLAVLLGGLFLFFFLENRQLSQNKVD